MKKFKGTVISSKMNKTVIVETKHLKINKKYHKRFLTKKNYSVHNELGAAEGDVVVFVETRPISKTKRWKVAEVFKKEKRAKK